MFRSRCTRFVTLPALVVTLCCLSLQANADSNIAPDEPIDAIWRVQRLNFTYRSSNVYYSCDALQSKIAEILRAVGAYRRVHVDVRCASGRFVNHAYARVTLAAPTEATEENVEAATTFDSRARLAATVRKIRLPTPNDIERFPAAWQTVSLLSLDPGDCDLIRGMQEQIFSRLSVRLTTGLPRCTSFATKMRPKIEVTALMRVPD